MRGITTIPNRELFSDTSSPASFYHLKDEVSKKVKTGEGHPGLKYYQCRIPRNALRAEFGRHFTLGNCEAIKKLSTYTILFFELIVEISSMRQYISSENDI